MFNKYNDGWIEVITGPMFAGKSAELIKRAETLIYAKKEFLVFKPKLDNRWKDEVIKSRRGMEIKSFVIQEPSEIKKHLTKETKAIIIDEAQFFDETLVVVLQELATNGLRVIVACLDMDFMQRPFGQIPNLLAVSEFVTKLTAVCFKCGRAASFSQRIKGAKNKIEIGDEAYEARCRQCFVFPKGKE